VSVSMVVQLISVILKSEGLHCECVSVCMLYNYVKYVGSKRACRSKTVA